MTATTPAVPSSEELALELRRWCVKRQFTQHEEQMFADVIAALRAPAGNDGPVLPRKISAEIACILEDCDGPEKQKPEVVAALIDEYQPLWNKLRAALPQREAGEPGNQTQQCPKCLWWTSDLSKHICQFAASPIPDVPGGREEIIEECAKVCDRWIRSKNLHEHLAATDIARDIRALKPQDGGETGR